MMEWVKELLVKVSTPGDIASILLAGTVGFVVDAGLDPFDFLSGPQTGIVAAGLALGVKKVAEAEIDRRREVEKAKRERELLHDAAKRCREKADNLLKILNDDQGRQLAHRLRKAIQLHDQQIIPDEDLQVIVKQITAQLMSASPPPSHPQVPLQAQVAH